MSGPYKVVCDRCGFVYMNNQLRLEWNGLRTCHGPGTVGCWEPMHPLERPKPTPVDKQRVPWTRPEGEPVFVEGEPDL